MTVCRKFDDKYDIDNDGDDENQLKQYKSQYEVLKIIILLISNILETLNPYILTKRYIRREEIINLRPVK